MGRIAVVGATGAIGSRLVDALVSEGTPVVSLSRSGRPDPRDLVTVRATDVQEVASTAAALNDCQVAYYLVHALDTGEGFAERDAQRAHSFGRAAAQAGVTKIIYLGGLGEGSLSKHLASRQEVGEILAEHVPTVEIRAAVILGAGSISFEMVRYLTERLPMMVTPKWVRTPMQPIGMNDMIQILLRARDEEPGVIEVGISQTVSYSDLLAAYAKVRGLRRRLIVPVPLLSLTLSSYWVDLVTPLNRKITHSLIESLGVPVKVTSERRIIIERSVEDLISEVLAEQAASLDAGPVGPSPTPDGVSVMRAQRSLPGGTAEAAVDDLARIGGNLEWYGVEFWWRIRLKLGRLFGEDLRLRVPERLERGARVDWWIVTSLDDGGLTLRSEGWRFGEAWLRFQVAGSPESPVMRCVGAFRPLGILGWAYWLLAKPLHLWAFRSMASRRVRRTRRS